MLFLYLCLFLLYVSLQLMMFGYTLPGYYLNDPTELSKEGGEKVYSLHFALQNSVVAETNELDDKFT